MAVTGTTLNGAVTNTAQKIKLTAYTAPALGTGVNAGNKVVRVDGEWMRITDDSASPTLGVTRGEFGTVAVAHNSLAAAAYGLTSDMQAVNSSLVFGGGITSYSVSGAITIPALPPGGIYTIYLTKAGVAAMTLAAPPLDIDGALLTITSNTANAHTITATSLFNDGASGAPHTTATYAAFAGATVTLEAAKGLWNVIANNGVTFS